MGYIYQECEALCERPHRPCYRWYGKQKAACDLGYGAYTPVVLSLALSLRLLIFSLCHIWSSVKTTLT